MEDKNEPDKGLHEIGDDAPQQNIGTSANDQQPAQFQVSQVVHPFVLTGMPVFGNFPGKFSVYMYIVLGYKNVFLHSMNKPRSYFSPASCI